MKKNFLHRNENLFEIPRNRFIAGILIGLGYAISFYSILYLTRESFRIFSAIFTYGLWVLSDSAVNFYNIFFAFISVIFGQSICFTFWFNKPKKLFSRYYLRQTSIVNDQRVFTWYFLSWFSKLAVVFGVLFGTSLHGAHYVFSFYPKYNYVFILIIIVLFFSSWNNIRLTYKKQSLKWLTISIFTVTLLSLGLSRVNVIDYKAINEIYLNNSINYKYNLALPESDIYSRQEKLSLVEDIYIVLPKNGNHVSLKPKIVINRQEVDIEEVYGKLWELKQKREDWEKNFIVYQLSIDKDINMKIVNDVKFQISRLGASRIAYSVIPKNAKFDQMYYKGLNFSLSLPGTDSSRFNIYEALEYFDSLQNIIEVEQLENGNCIINDTIVHLESLKKTLQTLAVKSNVYDIKFYPSNKVDYSLYLSTLINTSKALTELRDYYSISKYYKKFDELIFEEEINDVRKKYPIRLLELTEQTRAILWKEKCKCREGTNQ